ncbi:MAG TPA: hypothetical protein VFO41_04550 [Alphaproteobacteria bacterium]|jgi:hypothetical protein|nr:hypothetical protein [Alphaproteobacteria bacterium]
MWLAHERKHLDRRSLGLSIVLHLLLLLFLISRWHRPPIQLPESADRPELILDLPEPPPAPPENPKPTKDSAGAEQANAKPSPSAAPVPTPMDSPAPPLLQPVVQPIVRLPEPTSTKMPSSNPLSEQPAAMAPGATATSGVAGNAAGTASGAGGGDGPGGGGTSAERPDWIRKPDIGERIGALSRLASRRHANGWAVLSCLVTRSNKVRDCRVIGESLDPKGGHSYEFGKSALRMSDTFRIRPPKRNGQPRYDIRVRIPIYWNWD